MKQTSDKQSMEMSLLSECNREQTGNIENRWREKN